MSKNCGLYRATKPVPTGDTFLEGPRLVYFHNHSKEGPPMVMLPESNTHNRWKFPDKGFLITSDDFVAGLETVRSEGLYRFKEHFHPNETDVVNKGALVQLGYNGAAEPIVFFPQRVDDQNAWLFPTSGMKIPQQIYDLLEPVDTRGPYKTAPDHVH